MSIDRVSNSSAVTYNQPSVKDMVDKEAEFAKNEDNDKEVKPEQTKESVEEVVKGMNEFLQPINTSIKFELHEKLQEYYVTIVDDKTKEVIREIPSKKLMDVYAAMTEFLGLVVDKKI